MLLVFVANGGSKSIQCSTTLSYRQQCDADANPPAEVRWYYHPRNVERRFIGSGRRIEVSQLLSSSSTSEGHRPFTTDWDTDRNQMYLVGNLSLPRGNNKTEYPGRDVWEDMLLDQLNRYSCEAKNLGFPSKSAFKYIGKPGKLSKETRVIHISKKII